VFKDKVRGLKNVETLTLFYERRKFLHSLLLYRYKRKHRHFPTFVRIFNVPKLRIAKTCLSTKGKIIGVVVCRAIKNIELVTGTTLDQWHCSSYMGKTPHIVRVQ
jgi:hypothetical protein